MSISLNDHENRIKALENKFITSSYREDYLVRRNVKNGDITIPASIRNYKLIHIIHSWNGYKGSYEDITISVDTLLELKSVAISTDNGGAGKVTYTNDTTLNLSGGHNGYISDIIGITWGGGYKLWNFVKKITSLYQNILKTISLTILGGEVI